MNQNLARILGAAASTKLDPHADKLFAKVSGPIERPRMNAGNDAMQAAYTKSVPPNGVYFVNIERDTLEQWVFDHWEVVAQHNAEDQLAIDTNQPLAPRATPAPFSMGAGGGGVSPAPRQPGGPSITDPMSGGMPTLVNMEGLPNTAPPIPVTVVNDAPIATIATFDPMTGQNGTQQATQFALIFTGTLIAGMELQIYLFINGVSHGIVFDTTDAGALFGFTLTTGPQSPADPLWLDVGDVVSWKAHLGGGMGNLNIVIQRGSAETTSFNLQ